jgi:hypothetical protein
LNPIIDNPFAVFAIALVTQWGAALVGDLLRRRIRPLKKDEREDFDTVLAASLTLLALIIGFSFSMAVSRYDQRKNYEEAEANAIGTAYLRADLLSSENTAKIRQPCGFMLTSASIFTAVIKRRALTSATIRRQFRISFGPRSCARAPRNQIPS